MYQFFQIKFYLLLGPLHGAHTRVHLKLQWETSLTHSPQDYVKVLQSSCRSPREFILVYATMFCRK